MGSEDRGREREREREKIDAPDGLAWKGALAVALAVGGLVVWRACAGPDAPAPAGPAASGSAAATGAAPALSSAAAAAPPRCAPLGPAPFVIGDAPRAPRPPPGDAGDAAGDEPPAEDEFLPFAVEVGRGTTFDGGFAVGAQRQAEGGAVAMVATLGPDGAAGKLVRLARSRGDLDPPVVTGAGPAIFAAMMEPNAGGRAIRIAKVLGDEVTWGAELSEGRDESLALDLAVSAGRLLIVWDDVTRDGKRSRIQIASVDAGSLQSVTSARPVSPPKTDAEVPRVIPRPGGYWLAWVARAEEAPVKEDREDRAPPKKEKSKGKGKPKQEAPVDEDTEAAGETIAHQWIEIVPLDETGAPTAIARAVTPKDGNVLAYDLAPGDDGGALVAFRDDDTPSGSSGGRVAVIHVGLGGAGDPRPIVGAEEGPEGEGAGAGVPTVLPGWISLANVAGATRLAAMNGRGEILDGLWAEAVIGHAEPLAALKDAVLIARPAGVAMKLEVLRCAAGTPRPKAAVEEKPAEAKPPESAPGELAPVPGRPPDEEE